MRSGGEPVEGVYILLFSQLEDNKIQVHIKLYFVACVCSVYSPYEVSHSYRHSTHTLLLSCKTVRYLCVISHVVTVKPHEKQQKLSS